MCGAQGGRGKVRHPDSGCQRTQTRAARLSSHGQWTWVNPGLWHFLWRVYYLGGIRSRGRPEWPITSQLSPPSPAPGPHRSNPCRKWNVSSATEFGSSSPMPLTESRCEARPVKTPHPQHSPPTRAEVPLPRGTNTVHHEAWEKHSNRGADSSPGLMPSLQESPRCWRLNSRLNACDSGCLHKEVAWPVTSSNWACVIALCQAINFRTHSKPSDALFSWAHLMAGFCH